MENLNMEELTKEAMDNIQNLSEEEVKQQLEQINPTESDYQKITQYYGLSDSDTQLLLKALIEYKRDNTKEYYDELPKNIKSIIDGLRRQGGTVISVKNATNIFLDSLIRDAQFDIMVNEYTKELSETMVQMNKDYQSIVVDSIDEMYKNINAIAKEDPEKADSLLKFKEVFDKAKTMNKIFDFLDNPPSKITAKKLNKSLNKYDNECFYFNKKINRNKFGISVADINRIVPVIKKAYSGFTETDIKKFVLIIIQSSNTLDPDNIYEVAYIYRIISNILSYEFSPEINTDADLIFDSIKQLIQRIINIE